ncbi:biliverdin-producing heme oxygenase [Bradyrhizobium sp. ARR65]|uniref:biliverdin-producing heme oxygenase n=1 Tax=Bradyrhizobium sp. ARR65 TaxID=1040989 RepID=UPI000463727F|nr:biliverdin-producing heme oxygenase [Bradyrhizobium sp. ARR65]
MNTTAIASRETDEPRGLAKRLKAATHNQHDALDKRIMGLDPFGSRARYATFLKIQHDFHQEIDPLYNHPGISTFIADLSERRRLDLIRQDIVDTGGTLSDIRHSGDLIAVPNAVGWLYVAEGSKLGAAFLLKGAEKLRLSESFGARHLAAHIDGRGIHWRRFTAAIDAIPFTAADDARAIEGARQAFARVRFLVEKHFGTINHNERVAKVSPPPTAQ